MGVVDRGVEDAFEGTLVKKLAPMSFRLRLRSVAVGGHGVDRAEGAFGDEATEGAMDGALADGAQLAQENVAGAAFDQDEEPAAAGTPGDDAIHLPIAKALTGEDFRRAFLDAPALWEDLAATGVAPTAHLAGTITQMAFGQDDDAVFEMVVDGPLRGKVRPTLASERVQAGGDGVAFLEEVLNEAVGESGGHHRPSSLVGVGLLGALLGFEGGILRLNPAAMDFVAQQDAGEPGLQFALYPTVRKTVSLRESAHGQRPAPAVYILIPEFLQGHPSFPSGCRTFFCPIESDTFYKALTLYRL